jgi:hypothetical protein
VRELRKKKIKTSCSKARNKIDFRKLGERGRGGGGIGFADFIPFFPHIARKLKKL